MSVINSIPLIAAGDDGYQISRSVRLRSSASAYFNRTPATSTNQRTWTWSAWVKLGSLSNGLLFSAGTSTSNVDLLYFNTSTNLFYFNSYFSGAYQFNVNSSAVYRDPSAWYHVVFALDTTQSTSTNRAKLYVNGVQQTLNAGSGGFGSQNLQLLTNSTVEHDIGRYVTYTSYFDGYMAEVNFIDGQALTPSSFGETDSLTGVWKPKRYAGTYGTNGFYLNFSDNSAATAAAIGKDSSGNGNNWTPNNISVTSGVTYDSMLDVPTMWADGGNGRGNYCTLNPLTNQSSATISGANLNVSGTVTHSASTTFAYPISGKWYCEIQITSTPENALNELIGITPDVGTPNGVVRAYASNGQYFNGSTWGAFGAAWSINDVIGIAADIDNSQLSFYKNGTLQGSVQSYTFTSTAAPMVRMRSSGTSVFNANFGQRPFAYTPPTGFKALNTQNLPDATIKKGNQYFDVSTWTGNSTSRSITNSGGFQPDLVWSKCRSTGYNHALFDSVRGANKALFSNSTAAEISPSASGGVSSFNSDGFSLQIGTSDWNQVNTNGDAYVGWQWKESASAGFDIVTYTGNSGTPNPAQNQTINHSLGVIPSMIIVKSRNAVDNWFVWHKSMGATLASQTLFLNATNALFTSTTGNVWGFGSFTSSQFVVGDRSGVNQYGVTHVAYLFAEVAGFSKFGSYTGNGAADGPFVYLGFRPAYVLVKRTDAAVSWIVEDTARDTTNPVNPYLLPNTSDAEASTTSELDFLSNGFKIRNTGSAYNTSGGSYIYAAFAENPTKYSLAR